MNKYKVTYSRKMAGGLRLIAYNQEVSASDFSIMASDTLDSRYGYIIIKAELIYSGTDLLELDSVNYKTREE
jgi:hypothetical protein